jgi:hypothetical protein
MARAERLTINEWGESIYRAYGEFDDKDGPGVRYFNFFRNMVREMQPTALKPNNDFQSTVSFDGNDYFLSFRINSKKTFEADDYVPITGRMVTESLQSAIKNMVRPFWIEIQGTWSSVLFTDGKRNYQAEIVLDKKNSPRLQK